MTLLTLKNKTLKNKSLKNTKEKDDTYDELY